MLYKKKPVVVEAMQYTPETMAECFRFLEESNARYQLIANDLEIVKLKIVTLECEMTVSYGDYIIRDVLGKVYPCKPHIFRELYENYQDFKVIDVLNYVAAGLVEPNAPLDMYDYEYEFDGSWFTRLGQKGMEPLEVHSLKALNKSVRFFATRGTDEVEKIDLTTRKGWMRDETD